LGIGRVGTRRTAGRQLVAVAVDDLPFAVLGATVAALTTGQSWLDALLDTLKMRRQLGGLIAAQLPDVPWQPPQATYLAWLDSRRIGDGEQPGNVFPTVAASHSNPDHGSAHQEAASCG